jgi:hypothetical protein
VWDRRPTPDDVLDQRVRDGWRPTASAFKDADVIDGFACSRFWPDRDDPVR